MGIIRFSLFTPCPQFSNNRSAIQCSDFVEQAISDFLAAGLVVKCERAPAVVTTLVSFHTDRVPEELCL